VSSEKNTRKSSRHSACMTSCMRTEAELNRIASEIIGAGIAVHTRVGPGCFESAYLPCLAYELHRRSLAFRTKVAVAIQYETIEIPRAYEVDFLVEGSVVVELKATRSTRRWMPGNC
jgi:GxxExxY protein